jgi:hypothetical protein
MGLKMHNLPISSNALFSSQSLHKAFSSIIYTWINMNTLKKIKGREFSKGMLAKINHL